MIRFKMRSLSGLCLGALVLGGCFRDQDTLGLPCTVNESCGEGQVCVDDICLPTSHCAVTGAECPDGLVCDPCSTENNGCVPEPKCPPHGGSSDSGSSSSTTDTTPPPCDAVQLADVAEGRGGFALDAEAEDNSSGWAVSAAGDVNGDGLDDIIVGARKIEPNGVDRAGRAYLVFAKTDTERMSLADVVLGIGGFALDGAGEIDYAGQSVSGAGDVNGDGLADVIVGSHGAPGGRTYVVFGKSDTEAIPLADVAQGIGGFAVDGEVPDSSGYSLSGAGDVNGDGLADVVVGGRLARAYVVLGKADTEAVLLADVVQGIGGFALDGEAHSAVSEAGDVNGDGLDDVVIGAPSAEPNGVSSGRTYVVFGKASTALVSLADVAQGMGGFVLDGEAYNDESGSSVSGAGDVNGDGLPDVVVGAPGAPQGADSGHTYVVFGKSDTQAIPLADVVQGVGGFVLVGEASQDRSGSPVSGAGDINGDGLADVIVGAPGKGGRAYVVFGKAKTGMVILVDVAWGIGGFVLDGEAEFVGSGLSVSGAGDVNGDGFPDVVVGARRADPNGSGPGRIYVVLGGDLSCGDGS
jgi:hypothetical protein